MTLFYGYAPPRRHFDRPFDWEMLSIHQGTKSPNDIDHNLCYIHSVPFEILSDIFQLSITWRTDRGNPHAYLKQIKHGDTPLSLLSVCRNWRAVALQTPELWNSICPSWNSIPCMKFWLRVAPPVPFHLKIVDTLFNCGVYPQFPCLTLQLFSSVSHRWKSLSIQLTAQLGEEFLSILQNQPLPLESLQLDMLNYTDNPLTSDTASDILKLLPSLPHLKRLYLDTGIHLLDPQTIPWSTLEHITLKHDLTTTEAFSCLIQCTSAKSVDLQRIWFPESYLPSELIGKHLSTLPHLTSLTLSQGADPIIILQNLSLPSIRYLSVEFMNRNLILLDKFLARTPTLETLVIFDAFTDSGSRTPQADDSDIIAYFLNSHLRRIPSVYLWFKGAVKRVPKIVKEYPDVTREFPQLVCWEAPDDIEMFPFCGPELIGWDDNLDSHPRWHVFWQFQNGRLELPPPQRQSIRFDRAGASRICILELF